MKHARLGRSGLVVPQLALGSGGFGGGPDWPYGTTGQEQADVLVRRCLDRGVDLFDSADVYGSGTSQEILGRALRGLRDEVLVSAKVGLPTSARQGDAGNGRHHLVDAVEATLRRLGADHVDLLQLHVFDALTPLEETLSVLDALVRDGKVRYVGVSNFAAWQLMKTIAVAEREGLVRPISQQVYYSLVGRDYELELMEVGLDQGLGALVWSPLAGGWLSGEISRNRPPAAGSRVDRLGAGGPPVDRALLDGVVDVLERVAGETGRSVPQIAMNWLLQKPTVSGVVFGADSAEQLDENLGAAGWDLDPEQVSRLDAASQTMPTYPHYMYHRDPGFSDLAPVAVRRAL